MKLKTIKSMKWFKKNIKGKKGTGKDRRLYKEIFSKDDLVKINVFYMEMVLFLELATDETKKHSVLSNILSRREYEMRDLILFFLKNEKLESNSLLNISSKSNEIISNMEKYINEYCNLRYESLNRSNKI